MLQMAKQAFWENQLNLVEEITTSLKNTKVYVRQILEAINSPLETMPNDSVPSPRWSSEERGSESNAFNGGENWSEVEYESPFEPSLGESEPLNCNSYSFYLTQAHLEKPQAVPIEIPPLLSDEQEEEITMVRQKKDEKDKLWYKKVSNLVPNEKFYDWSKYFSLVVILEPQVPSSTKEKLTILAFLPAHLWHKECTETPIPPDPD